MKRVNEFLTRFFPLLITGGLVGGIFLGDLIIPLQVIVPFVFASVTFISSLTMNFNSFKETLMTPKPMIAVMLVLRLIMPLWAMLVGNIVFQGDIYTTTGIILFALLPTGINSAIWVMMYKGNVPLTLSIIFLDTFLSPFLLPLSLALLTGTTVEMEVGSLMISLIQMVVLPSFLGMVINQLTKGEVNKTWSPRLAPFAKIGLIVVVIINGAMSAPHFESFDFNILIIMITVFFLSFSGYVISWMIGNLFKFDQEEIVSLVYSGGMRNVSVGIVIAVSYFPSEVSIPVIIAILFQQTINGLVGFFLSRREKKVASEILEEVNFKKTVLE